jgi:hypothetical protein
MASDGNPVTMPGARSVQGIGAPTAAKPIAARPVPARPIAAKPIPARADGSGTVLPPGNKPVAAAAAQPSVAEPQTKAASVAAASANVAPKASPSVYKPPVLSPSDPQVLVTQLNKYLNDSGRPDQFRVAPSSGDALIQQINPATGAVVGEYSASEFPALARSVGALGTLVDSLA